MEKHHAHTHGCTHCSCNNPVLEILKEELFSPENLEKMKSGLGKTATLPSPTLMISGGTIRPMINGLTDSVEAIGIAGGNVVVTGKKTAVAEFMAQTYPGYETRELSHKETLLPGLIEPHVHIVPTAMMTEWVDVSPFDGQNLKSPYNLLTVGEAVHTEISKIKKKFKNETISDFVILGRGLDPSLMPFVKLGLKGNDELQPIDNTILDKITTEFPMMLLSASMHTLYLNTSALKYVFKNNKEVRDQYLTVDHYIEKTKGTLEQSPEMTPAMKVVAPQIVAMAIDIEKYLTELFRLANSRGATFMYDAGLNSGFEKLLTNYVGSHAPLVRIGGAYLCADQADVTKLGSYQQPVDYTPVYYGHVKVVSDGSNQGLTGYQSEHYRCDPPKNRGIFNYTQTGVPPNTMPPNYNTLISTVVNQGWPLMIHANGDQAVTFAVDAYQSALAQYRGPGLRNRIEHCSMLTKEHITAMLQMGVSPSFLIGHVGYWGHAFSKVIFGEKVKMLDLCGSALAAGMRITLHSDNEVSPLGPLRMMEQSITRIMEEHTETIEVLNAEERLSPEQALVAVTYDAAWQCYADKWVGSLTPGYFADFVILAEDPLSMTKQSEQFMKMRNIQVVETWLGGVLVYDADTPLQS
jgi:predicted amidohydrolase YtcJ